MGEDLDTWARLAWSGPIGFIPQVLAVYHDTGGACARNGPGSDLMATYQLWRESGRIPSALSRSSACWAHFLRCQDIHRHLAIGNVNRARDLLAGISWPKRVSFMGLGGYLAFGLLRFSRFAALTNSRWAGLWRLWQWKWRA